MPYPFGVYLAYYRILCYIYRCEYCLFSKTLEREHKTMKHAL